MKVNVISGAELSNNKINFSGKQHNGNSPVHTTPKELSSMAKVPVIVLLAMNPATLNSVAANPKMYSDMNEIEVVAPAATEKSDKATYVMLPEIQESQQSNYPYGWKIFTSALNNIKFATPAKGNGADYTMVFTATSEHPNDIGNVYLVKKGQKGSSVISEHPPEVSTLVLHNLGEGKEGFCSVITQETIVGDKGVGVGTMTRQLLLDDDTAQKIIDLLGGQTKWKNSTLIDVKEVNDANIMRPRSYFYN